MITKILFFAWLALMPDAGHDSEHQTLVQALEDRCHQRDPKAQLTEWYASPRRYSFEWKGQTIKTVYSGRDYICILEVPKEKK